MFLDLSYHFLENWVLGFSIGVKITILYVIVWLVWLRIYFNKILCLGIIVQSFPETAFHGLNQIDYNYCFSSVLCNYFWKLRGLQNYLILAWIFGAFKPIFMNTLSLWFQNLHFGISNARIGLFDNPPFLMVI